MADRKAPMAKTTLSFGLVSVPVGLLKMTDEPAEAKYVTAGPNGHPLHTETRLFKPGTDEVVEMEPVRQELPPEPPVDDPEPKPMDPTDPEAAQKAFAAAAGLDELEQRQVLVEDETNVYVPKGDVRRGILASDGSFVDLTAGLAEIDEATKLDEMGVVAFMDIGQVPRELVRGSSYLCADSPDATRALGILHAGMRETRRAAVVKWTKRSKQALGVIVADGRTGALVALEMAWPNHVRAAESDQRILAHAGYQQRPEMVATCVDLIGAMSVTREGSFERQRDDRELLRAELLERVAAGEGEEFSVPARPQSQQQDASVEDLIAESEARADEFSRAA